MTHICYRGFVPLVHWSNWCDLTYTLIQGLYHSFSKQVYIEHRYVSDPCKALAIE